MKPHFASLAHYMKSKKNYERNHFLKNKITAKEKKSYNSLKERLLKNNIPLVQTKTKKSF